MIIDAEATRMELIVPDDKLSLAIGKKGQNVRLASQLTGWRIDIHSESKVREMEARARQSLAAIGRRAGGFDAHGSPTRCSSSAGARSASSRPAIPDELAAVPGVGGVDGAKVLIASAAKAAEIERVRQAEEAERAAKDAATLVAEAPEAPNPEAPP